MNPGDFIVGDVNGVCVIPRIGRRLCWSRRRKSGGPSGQRAEEMERTGKTLQGSGWISSAVNVSRPEVGRVSIVPHTTHWRTTACGMGRINKNSGGLAAVSNQKGGYDTIIGRPVVLAGNSGMPTPMPAAAGFDVEQGRKKTMA